VPSALKACVLLPLSHHVPPWTRVFSAAPSKILLLPTTFCLSRVLSVLNITYCHLTCYGVGISSSRTVFLIQVPLKQECEQFCVLHSFVQRGLNMYLINSNWTNTGICWWVRGPSFPEDEKTLGVHGPPFNPQFLAQDHTHSSTFPNPPCTWWELIGWFWCQTVECVNLGNGTNGLDWHVPRNPSECYGLENSY
jgi:hypothetical protein